MKLKYYLRGLGIGIAVTAAVLMLAGGGKESLTDEEIIARAKELGMVESVTLSQLSSEKVSETDSEEVSEDLSEDAVEDSSESLSEVTGEEDISESTSEVINEEMNSEEDVSEVVSETSSEETSQTASGEVIDEFVIIEVGSGDGSDSVSVKLEAAGLVEDAGMYDDFLCANGYDKILQTGVHEIPRTADWDTIAEILAGRM
ncbi:MAG: hypothetical protein IJZ42_06540 [Lachnospiraceae bacterium]|nr:hypothetical protein [Lachnospiraceae bacterium]